MADHYCPFCGENHGGEPESEPAAEVIVTNEVTSAEVEIARINAKRDVDLARIQAGVLDHDRDEELAHAEGRAEGMAEALDAVTPDPEPVPEPDPVVVVPDDPEPSPDVLEPPMADHADSEPRPRSKSRSLGMW